MVFTNKSDLDNMRIACKLTRQTLEEVSKFIKPGVTTKQLDEVAYNFIVKNNARPSFLHYNGFPASICTSINEQVVHGIPGNRVLKEGDIISVDCGVHYNGFHGDCARTYAVGNISEKNKKLIQVTRQSFYEGLKDIKANCFVGDISHKIQNYVERSGFSVVRDLIGHGVGKNLHEEPDVPNFGRAGSGAKLLNGMVIAVEPMVNSGAKQVEFLSDGWTCVTRDRKTSSHYENTILITEDGVEILTVLE